MMRSNSKDVRNIYKPDDNNNSKLVFASGFLKNDDIIYDEEFDFYVENSIKLVRLVEMY